MKAALLVLALAAGCSIDHVSDSLACTASSQCADGRNCVGGFCVVPGGGGGCPSQCTACDTTAMTCSIVGNGDGGGDRTTCPSGYHCDITCAGSSCRTVDCSNAASCTIQCTGKGSCEQITCGPERCQVTCSGQDSCQSVDCQDSCACDVQCTGAQSCSSGSRCPLQSCDTGTGCSSQPLGCNLCQ